MHESAYHKASTFVTLTYSDDNLPKDGLLVKKHFQDWLKRLRKAIAPRKIKYFACGEYGDTFNRPHYHAIIFGLSQTDLDIVRKTWPLGFVKLGTVTKASARYVSKYLYKQQSVDSDSFKKAPPFKLQSAGLGLQYALDNQDKIKKDLYVRSGKSKVAVPRYYRKKLDITAEDYEPVFTRLNVEKIDTFLKQAETPAIEVCLRQARLDNGEINITLPVVQDFFKASALQVEREFLAKQEVKRKRRRRP